MTKMMNHEPAQERLQELLSYSPETGECRWLADRRNGQIKAGVVAPMTLYWESPHGK
jgi:hypothetical protein